MKLVLFLITVFSVYFTYGTSIGYNTFYSSFLLTNGEYGSGASFPCKVWFNGPAGLMRIDYSNPNGTKFMSVFYNYTSGDKYEVCGSTCARATWNAPIPQFYADSSLFSSVSCEKPDYPGPYACSTAPNNCKSYLTNPNQPTGIYSLSFNDAGLTQLCLVRWTPATGDMYGPEWQISSFITSGWNSSTDPTILSTYSSVLSGVTCPQPTCYAQLDISIIVDESGSIFAASAWNDVQSFVVNLISSFNMGSNAIRAGLTYFSGLSDCTQNWTGSKAVDCPGYTKADGYKDGNCEYCGGRWDQYTTGVITDKAGLIKLAKSNTGAKGFTCISCGVDLGIKTLNYAPKANVGKIIILFTDGAENRVTASLPTQGKTAYDMGIKIIAVATGAYKYSDLQIFTNTIYTSATYSGLSSLINQIVTPLCQPLPSIDTCDFCSGLCTCSTTCQCPSCNDYNMCTTDNCNIAAPPTGTDGLCVSIPLNCDDHNPCTVNNCYNATGCDYNTPTPIPIGDVNSFCKNWICTNPSGFQYTDVGTTSCPPGNDKCYIIYCNTTVGTTTVNGVNLAGSCQYINRTQYVVGTTITYTNSAGQTLSTSGCAAPAGTLPCQQYYCNSTSGSCGINNGNCKCMTDSDCNDGIACTIDKCDTVNNKCLNTAVDCWSIVSNGACITNVTTGGVSTATGVGYYYNNITFSTNGQGLPTSPIANCDNLACFGGQKSTYTCLPSGNSYVCQRQVVACTSTACSDSICRSLGNWTNGQMNTDCGNVVAKTCSDGNACTADQCNSAWSGTSCTNSGSCASQSSGQNRCLFPSNSSSCTGSNVCLIYGCNNSTGCTTTNKATPTPNYCLNTGCNPSTGNYSTVNTTACTQGADLCVISYCSTTIGTTNGKPGSCQTINKRTLAQTSTQTYTDAGGVVHSVTGCANVTATCFIYGCNATTGLCTIDSSQCGCTMVGDPKCDDGNGCTNDSCDTVNHVCINTPIDCWNEVSGNGCTINQVFTSTNATGVAFYNGNGVPATYNDPLGSNLNCDQLACFNGQQSQYTCQSLSNTTHQCVRSATDCAKGGCDDTICTSLSTWTNGQLNTDCSSQVIPTCTSNQCYISTCDSNYVYGSGGSRCILTYNGSNCDDNNPCTQNLCNNNTGCDFSQPTVQPIANNTCTQYYCDPTYGFLPIDIGHISCPSMGCQIMYCNTTSDSCVNFNLNVLTINDTEYYVDSDGVLKSITGCAYTDPVINCKTYQCNSNQGGICQIITSNCVCQSDADCEDGNGCTIDKCDFFLNKCIRTNVDCYSDLSNGTCPEGSTYTADIDVGLSLYYGNATVPNNFTAVDANGLPSPAYGVSRTCAQLGCYNGAPSQYSCFSVAEGSHTCVRTYLNCSRNGCQDNICRTLGTWGTLNNTGQIDADCGTTYQPICTDGDSCTQDYCNSAWVPTQPVSQRCLHTPINGSQYCDDGNYCTQDYCDSQDTSGNFCKHNLYADWYVKRYLCTNSTVCQTVQCTVNRCVYSNVQCVAPTLCLNFICNASTNGICQQFPTGLYKIDKCGVCGGNGLSCVPTTPANPKAASIAVALGVGLGVGLAVAAAIIACLSKKSFDAYNALAVETQGHVTTSPVHQGGEHHIDTTHYGD